MAIVTYNDNGTIKVVKFGNKVVSTDADPVVQKQWVFQNGMAAWLGTKYEVVGIMDGNASQGCAPSYVLLSELNSLSDPNGLAVGTQAAIRMNQLGETCGSWAVFEVRKV
jgi:D-serine deaminase-like pyridoxal phosphate-dependent protein